VHTAKHAPGTCSLALAVGLALAASAHAQPAPAQPAPVSVGDSTIVRVVNAELQRLYTVSRPALGLLTVANPLGRSGALGTEIQGFEVDGRLARVTASVWTARGKYMVEYFGAPDTSPRFVFESAAFRDDAPGRSASRNFWGEPSWERRLYLDSGRVVFTQTVGDGAGAAESAAVHARRFAALRALLETARAARR
jgi:hypothetical protein